MKLSPEQQRVLKIALAEAKKLGASARPTKALVAAGLVESNLTNVNHGDRDSLGFLQQRPSQGWGTPDQVRDVRYATRQFLERAIALNAQGFKGSAGQLAQAVQRSAFPERYDQRSADAESLLGGAGQSTGSTRGGAASRSSTVPGVDRSRERQALLLGYLENRHDPNALLSLGTGLKAAQDTPERKINLGGSTSSSSSSSTPRAGGSFAGTTNLVTSWSKRAHELGLSTTSGKRPTRNTASGGVSDHYEGSTEANARDWSGDPKAMAKLAGEIAKSLGTKGFKYGRDVTVTIDGYRYQLITSPHGSGPHVHLGVKKA